MARQGGSTRAHDDHVGLPTNAPGDEGWVSVTVGATDRPGGRSSYEWITPTRAAARLGVALRDVYRLIDTGGVPGYRIDHQVRLLAHEVDEVARRRR